MATSFLVNLNIYLLLWIPASADVDADQRNHQLYFDFFPNPEIEEFSRNSFFCIFQKKRVSTLLLPIRSKAETVKKYFEIFFLNFKLFSEKNSIFSYGPYLSSVT